MKYSYILEMDNEQGERCRVCVAFNGDSFKRFGGFTSIHSNNPLYEDDLRHLEEFVVMDKDKWVTNW
jgi:hypothetical protein